MTYCLACPQCCGYTLKQIRVKTYSREPGGDALVAIVEQVSGSVLVNARPDLFAQNPSPEGPGLSVTFECSDCDFVDDLHIYWQDERTRIHWRDGDTL